MSFVDFSQRAEDHTRILVLVLQLNSSTKPKNFNKIFERISRLHTLTIPTSPPRVVCLRYRKYYAIENNSWGDFQVHRRVLGLLSIGQCERDGDLEDILRQHEQQKEKYETTLLDSRLVLLDNTKQLRTVDKTNLDDQQLSQLQNSVIEDSVTYDDPLRSLEVPSNSVPKNANDSEATGNKSATTDRSALHRNGTDFAATALSSLNSAQILKYTNVDEYPDLEDRVQEFLASLFWVLESKRLDRSYEKMDQMILLTAPFELRKEASVGDSDSRVYKKRCQGRLKKQLGDLCLLAGVANESMLHYQTSIELLKATNDWLWLAGAYEGLASASVVLLKPRGMKQQMMPRISSFSLKRGISAMKETKSRTGGMSGSLQLTPSSLDLAVDNLQQIPLSLPEDILDNYKEAVINYSKFKDAGVVEMEASIKACRVLVEHQRTLAAADFLQNIVYINVQLMEEEKIQRFLTLAGLYHDIRMFRKAAFYYRIAAMQCVSASNQHPSWSSCYHLLMQALSGYQLSLDVKDMTKVMVVGWTSLQLRVLHELVYSARRMGNSAVAIRHLSFLLHTMFDCLSITERTDLAGVLKTYTSKCESTALSIALDDGTILPPVPFTRFPTVLSITLLPTVPHHRPVKFRRDRPAALSPVVANVNPFIYTPLFTSPVHDASRSKRDIHWVEGDVCEVLFKISNPLPFDIEVTSLGLMTEGVEVISESTSTLLPPGSQSMLAKIQVIPRTNGQMSITGYTTQVLGVKNHCKLRDLRHREDLLQTATVVPALPLLQVATSLPKASSFCTMADSDCVTANAAICVYAGQSVNFKLDFFNCGMSSVDRVDVLVTSSVAKDMLDKLLSWNEEQLINQMPMEPETHAEISINVTGISDFLSVDLLSNSAVNGAKRETYSSEFQRCSSIDAATGIVTLEVMILVQYSGGPGLQAGFCRQCSVSLTIDIIPSLMITDYLVTYADSVEKCRFIAEIVNVTDDDIELFNNISEHQLSYAVCDEAENSSETNDRQTLTVKGGHSIRLLSCIPSVAGCPTGDTEAVGCQSPVTDINCGSMFITTLTDTDTRSSPLQATLSRHVTNFVDIRWKMSSSKASGRLSLEAVDWTSPQCTLLRCCPLSWDVEINNRRAATGVSVAVHCSRPVSFKCTVLNCTDHELCNVEIQVMPFSQSLSSPAMVNESTSMLPSSSHDCALLIGSSQSFYSQLAAGESVSHACSFLFTHPGVFHVCVRCLTCLPSRCRVESGASDVVGPSVQHQWSYLLSVVVSDVVDT